MKLFSTPEKIGYTEKNWDPNVLLGTNFKSSNLGSLYLACGRTETSLGRSWVFCVLKAIRLSMYNMIYDLLKQSLPAKSAGGAALRTACFLESTQEQEAILRNMPTKQNNSFHKSLPHNMKSSERSFIQYHCERNPELYFFVNKKLANKMQFILNSYHLINTILNSLEKLWCLPSFTTVLLSYLLVLCWGFIATSPPPLRNALPTASFVCAPSVNSILE